MGGSKLTEKVKPDMTSIQDGITVNFAPAARYLLPKGWDSPDVTPEMLTAVAKKVADCCQHCRGNIWRVPGFRQTVAGCRGKVYRYPVLDRGPVRFYLFC